MNDRRLLLVLAGVFGTLGVLLLVLGVTVTPVAAVVALPFAGVAYLLWYHATGRLEARAHERARARTTSAGASANRGTNGGRSRRARESRRRTAEAEASGDQRGRRRRRPSPDGMTTATAAEVLGVDPDASEAEIRAAYRERVKAVHPDRGGDEETFQRVQRAYERLRN